MGRYKFSKGNQLRKDKAPWNKGEKMSDEYKSTHSYHKLGASHPKWKGGKTKDKNGYILVKSYEHPYKGKQHQVCEHRLVVENHLGRYLKPEEKVHHINHNPSDNRIENLMVFNSHYAHMKYAIIEKGMQSGEIIFDGRMTKESGAV